MLMVQNQESGPTVLTLQGATPFVWAPRGDVLGDDVQRMPDSVVDDLDFLRAVENGCLRVVGGDQESMARLAELGLEDRGAERRQRIEADRQRIEATLERRQERDLVAVSCLGPGPRGQEGACGSQVLRSGSRTAEDAPPLCAAHEGIADQFFYVQVPGTEPGGRPRTTWARTAGR